MKVHNLTDVATKTLEKHHLVGQSIVVDKELIAPGMSADVEDSAHVRAKIDFLVAIGALSVDALPPPYVLAKTSSGQTSAVMQPAAPVEPTPEPAPEPIPEEVAVPSTGKKRSK